MGMDVIGRNPSAPAGEYFQASVFSWAPIHALIVELCSDLFKEEALLSMAFNNGAGPTDQAVCTQIAIRFENWLEHHADGHVLEAGDLRLVSDGESPFNVQDDELKEWVEFLRHCGGFEVW